MSISVVFETPNKKVQYKRKQTLADKQRDSLNVIEKLKHHLIIQIDNRTYVIDGLGGYALMDTRTAQWMYRDLQCPWAVEFVAYGTVAGINKVSSTRVAVNRAMPFIRYAEEYSAEPVKEFHSTVLSTLKHPKLATAITVSGIEVGAKHLYHLFSVLGVFTEADKIDSRKWLLEQAITL